MIYQLALRIAKHYLRKNLGKIEFVTEFKDFENIAAEGLCFGNDLLIEQSERYLLQYLAKNAPDNAVIFDVGANIGNYAKHCKAQLPNAIIYAFEPSKSTFDLLQNKLGTEEYNLENCALGAKYDLLPIYNESILASLNSLIERKHPNQHWQQAEVVQVQSLDDYCKAKKIEQIYLLKIDTEGFEMEVLKGAKQKIAEGKIQNIQFEFGGSMLDSRLFFRDFWDLLFNKYDIYRILTNGLEPISNYEEKLENFRGNNFLGRMKS